MLEATSIFIGLVWVLCFVAGVRTTAI